MRRLSPVLAVALVTLLLLAVWLALAHATWTVEINGRVVGVTDGDTLTLLGSDHRQVYVRLDEIDAPERDQPFGYPAKQALSDLAFGRDVRVVVVDHDHSGRTVGRIYAGTVDVNAGLVRAGMAWVYTRYNHDPALPALEAEARAAHRGLWADANAVAPWVWRHEHMARRLPA
jgi:endonuclease YncB( thermonuclease family)